MKKALTLLLPALLVLLHHASAGPIGPCALQGSCCRNVSSMSQGIPLKVVKDAVMSPSCCTVKALIITTKRDKQLCIDPNSPFAIKVEEHLKKSKQEEPRTNQTAQKSSKEHQRGG